MMNSDYVKADMISRLRKVEGQIAGIRKMVGEGRHHNDVLNQIYAARKALSVVSTIFVKDLVEKKLAFNNTSENGHETVKELIDTIYRYVK